MAAEPAGGCLRVDGPGRGQVVGEDHLDRALPGDGAARKGLNLRFALSPFRSGRSLADVVNAILELDIAVRHVKEFAVGTLISGHATPATIICADSRSGVTILRGRDRRHGRIRGDGFGGGGWVRLERLSAGGEGSGATQE